MQKQGSVSVCMSASLPIHAFSDLNVSGSEILLVACAMSARERCSPKLAGAVKAAIDSYVTSNQQIQYAEDFKNGKLDKAVT